MSCGRLLVRVFVAMSVLCVACMDPMPLYAELGPTRRAAPVVAATPQAKGPEEPQVVGASAGRAAPAERDEDEDEASGDKKGERRGVVNINAASEEELERLPGVGPKMAAKIVQARERRRFTKASQLRRVKGIGPKKYAKLAPYIRVDGETTLVE
jgi:competence ComEA-like helix-hairpin-helix protein